MQIFGIEIKKKQPKVEAPSIVTPSGMDGATVLNSINAGAYYGMVLDVEGVVKNENDLIRRYREIAQYPDCDTAIEDIVNEAIICEDNNRSVEIVLEDLKVSESIKNKIREEFDNVIRLLRFNERGHDIFRSWYIDGRLYYHVMVDEDKIKEGIVELRPIDPRKIRRIKNVRKERTDKGVEVVKVVDEYYLYNDRGITEQTTQGVRMSLDSVVYVPSGLYDANSGMMLSYLHKVIKPVNQLKLMEDSLVIYRISRAPERRIFYIDVGNLPKIKAEQYVNDIMNRFRNKVVYDASTGEVRDDRKHLSMMEDFWMPRREGGKGTEITTLPGGQTLGQIEDIQYFQNKLYQALNVPISRLRPDQGFSLGRSSEITRDEVKFSKFISRLRNKFSALFNDALRVQLISKGVIRADEWDDMKIHIRYDFMKDNFYAEFKNNEVMTQRLTLLQAIDPYVGKYFSVEWVRKNVLQQNDDDIKKIDDQREEDKKAELNAAQHEGNVQATRQAAASYDATEDDQAAPEQQEQQPQGDIE